MPTTLLNGQRPGSDAIDRTQSRWSTPRSLGKETMINIRNALGMLAAARHRDVDGMANHAI
jgi:hypothetical protein